MKKRNISRRGFLLRGAATAAAAFAAGVSESMAKKTQTRKTKPPESPPPPPEDPPVTLSLVEMTITVNGKKHVVTVPAGKTLAEFLRHDLGLTGVKIGCGSAECGACTVLVNGRPHYSCMMLAALADNSVVETIEGISAAGDIHPLQKAFIESDALQCGFCTPGVICAAKGLLIRNSQPSVDDIRDALSGNLCRCGAYRNMVDAVQRASGIR